jgi:hypothetical protein
MTLACPSALASAPFDLFESVVWSIGLLAPVATFLALPRLLPLGREVAWSRARLMRPLAWLASRLAGDRAEAAAWTERLQAAWRREVEAEHAEGTRRGEVVRDGTLLARARAVGWVTGGFTLAAFLLLALIVVGTGDRQAGRLAVTLVATGGAVAWLARIAGAGATLWAESLALGRPWWARLGVGLLVGGGYGAVAAFAMSFVGLFVLVSMMSLLTLDAPSGREMMVALTFSGVAAATVGALYGALLVAPIAAGARRR